MLTRVQVVAAYRAGRYAARTGRRPHASPYDPGSHRPATRALALVWIQGYQAAERAAGTPPRVSYDA